MPVAKAPASCALVACPVGLRERVQKADRQLHKPLPREGPQRLAKSLQIAEAVCRLILAGTATKGARTRQCSFDPIDRFLVLGDVETGRAAMHTNPVMQETAQKRGHGTYSKCVT